MRPDTLAVHAGREDFARLCVHAPPLDLSSTYPLGDLAGAAEAFDALSRGEASDGGTPVYQRLQNPTVRRYERALAALEHTEDAVAFASGMAGLTAVLLAACGERRHVVAIRPLYGGSDHLLAWLLGLDVTWAAPGEIGSAVRPDTGLVVLETPQNPTLGTVDIRSVVAAAAGAPVLVDNTFATPIRGRTLQDAGAALVLHSATKYLGGHGDVVRRHPSATTADWAGRLRQVQHPEPGALLHPLSAYLLAQEHLPTLPFRVREAQARRHGSRRRDSPSTRPWSASCIPPKAETASSSVGPRPLDRPSVRPRSPGGLAAASTVMQNSAPLITPAVSLGSTDSLIQHPASLTHRLVDPAARQTLGITDGLLRLSVGLEDVEDLWSDLGGALDAAVPRRQRLVSRPRRTGNSRLQRRRPATTR